MDPGTTNDSGLDFSFSTAPSPRPRTLVPGGGPSFRLAPHPVVG
jgi:hypothetical protein